MVPTPAPNSPVPTPHSSVDGTHSEETSAEKSEAAASEDQPTETQAAPANPTPKPPKRPQQQRQSRTTGQRSAPAPTPGQSNIDNALANLESAESKAETEPAKPLTGIDQFEAFGRARDYANITRWIDSALASDESSQWTLKDFERIYTSLVNSRRQGQDTFLLERVWTKQLELQVAPNGNVLYQLIRAFTRRDEELVGLEMFRKSKLESEQARADAGDERAKKAVEHMKEDYERRGGAGDNLHKAVALAEEALTVGIPLTRSCFEFIMSAYALREDMESAQKWFNKMEELRLFATSSSYTTMITGYGAIGDMFNAQKWFEAYEQSRLAPHDGPYFAIVEALAANGKLDSAIHTLEAVMPATKLVPTIRHYNAILRGLAKGGELAPALELLERVKSERRATPNGESYRIVFQAAVEAGDLTTASELLDKIEFTWNSLTDYVALCIEKQSFDAALQAYTSGLFKGVTVDSAVLIDLVTALNANNRQADAVNTVVKALEYRPPRATSTSSASLFNSTVRRNLISAVNAKPILDLPLALKLHRAADVVSALTWEERGKLLDAYENNFKSPSRGMDVQLTLEDFHLLLQAQLTKHDYKVLGSQIVEMCRDMENRGLKPSPQTVTLVESGFDKMRYNKGKELFHRHLKEVGVLKDSGLAESTGVAAKYETAQVSNKILELLDGAGAQSKNSGKQADLEGARRLFDELIRKKRFPSVRAATRLVFVHAQQKQFDHASKILEAGVKQIAHLKSLERACTSTSTPAGTSNQSAASNLQSGLTHAIVRGYLASGRTMNSRTQIVNYTLPSVLGAENLQGKLTSTVGKLIWEPGLCSELLLALTYAHPNTLADRTHLADAALRVWHRLDTSLKLTNSTPSLSDYHHVMKLQDRRRLHSQVIHFWEELKRRAVTPDQNTYRLAITAYAHSGAEEKAMELFEEYLERPWNSVNIGVFDAIIEMKVRNGDVRGAVRIWRVAESKGLEPSKETYKYLAIGGAKLGTEDGWKTCRELIGAMRGRGWVLSDDGVEEIVEALCAGGTDGAGRAEEVLKGEKEGGRVLKIENVGRVVGALCAEGDVNGAERVWRTFGSGYQPTPEIQTSFITAHLKSNNFAQAAAIFDATPAKQRTSALYAVMLKAARESGDTDNETKWRGELESQEGVPKEVVEGVLGEVEGGGKAEEEVRY
ncbi:hypothetical protein HDV00_011189 [Rhizophlyctis rosea]|nr:hypothetical protein HDV00_011189 [Rhizophlyctis rosea]